jgi:chromate transporter
MTEDVQSGPASAPLAAAGGTPGTWTEVLAVFLRLGLTSFGGPVAHLGYFREEFVAKRQWLADRTYADIVALCQFLPGPASSQVGIAIGLSRAGYAGAFAAWVGFTMPSAIALVAFAYGVDAFGGLGGSGWLHGLKVAAVAVVAQAVLGMMRTLTPDRDRATIAVVTAGVILALPSAWTLVGMILVGGLVGTLLLRAEAPTDHISLPLPVSRRTGGVLLAIFFVLLAGLPLLAAATSSHGVELVDAFYRAGSLVFGGGHVILPLLQESVVPPGWVGNDVFLAGYGAAQAVPGPLTTFAAYLGAIMTPGPNGVAGAALCLVAAFVPSFLLVTGALPFWEELRRRRTAQAALRGVNAAVVGILLAALYDPVWTSGITSSADFALGAGAFLLLFTWKTPPWLVVVLCALGGAVIGAL